MMRLKMRFLGIAVCCMATIVLGAVDVRRTPDERFDLARSAWDEGNFKRSLEEFEALLTGPDGDRYLDRIALLSGELYRTVELAKDGRSIRVSPNGRWAAFETGTRASAATRIIDLEKPLATVVELRGTGLVFSAASSTVAFLRMQQTPDIVKCRDELEQLTRQSPGDRQKLANKQRELARLEASFSEIVLYDLTTGKERAFRAPGWLKTGLTLQDDGQKVYFTGEKETDAASSEICTLTAEGAVLPLTSGTGFKINPVSVPGNRLLLYSISGLSPFPKPGEAEPTSSPQRGGSAPTPSGEALSDPGRASQRPAPQPAAGTGGRLGQARRFAVMNLESLVSFPYDGTSPALSADGSTLIFLGTEGADTAIYCLKPGSPGKPAVVKKSTERIGMAVPSADGSSIVFDMTYTRNSEIFFIKSDGTGERRISWDLEPDRTPRFLDARTILAIRGEPRHSRAQIYDLESQSEHRLFHNNTIRTIAPEYEWVADPSGTRVLIQAERDGDTISPQRGVYLVDLRQKITKPELLDRLNRNLASEAALRAWSEKTFAPLRGSVQQAVNRVSISKLYEYQGALFRFDSKHISQPGNAKAAEYIYRQLQSFGYSPEYQPFESRGIKTANVLARLAGAQRPDIIYVLSGHFDSNQRGPGADDNSSATAVGLETARILANSALSSTVLFAFFTGEEAGLLGSREFARVAKEKDWKIAADLNNDMIGWSGDFRLDNTIRYSNAGIRDIQHAAAMLFSKMVTYDTRYVKSTDAVSFYDAFGDIVGGLGSYPVLGNPYYHQPTDLLETVNHQLLFEATKYNIAAIMMLASSPQPVKDLKIVLHAAGKAEISWPPGVEKNIKSYLVEYGPESAPSAHRKVIRGSRANLAGFALKKGERLVVAVKAIDARGIAGWDWARISSSVFDGSR